MKYVKVTNPILNINRESVSFERSFGLTFLLRKHNGNVLWKLGKDGVMVAQVVADAYGLDYQNK